MTEITCKRGGRSREAFVGMGLVISSIVIIALIPFALVTTPPMTDLPGHMGRYHVMLALPTSDTLQRYYSFEWRLIGNLGIDLLVRAIGPWIGVESGSKFIVALIPVLTILGITAVSRALHGHVQVSAIAACCLVFSNPFMFGFVNFSLSMALALLVFACWIASEDRPFSARLAFFSPAIIMVWITHAMGWGVLGLLVAGYELWRTRNQTGTTVLQILLRLIVFIPPLVLTLYWRDGGGGAALSYGSEILTRKAMSWIVALRGSTKFADIGTLVVLFGVIVPCVWRRLLVIDGRGASGAALLTIAFVVMPTTLFGSWGADERLAPITIISAVLSLRWTGSKLGGVLLVAISAALFTTRTGLITYRWLEQDLAYTSSLRALNFVPDGSRVHAIVLQSSCGGSWAPEPYSHLSDVAIIRRNALVNSQWLQSGSPLIRVIYAGDPQLLYDPSQFVFGFNCSGFDATPLRARLAQLRPDKWDFVWIFQTRGSQDLWIGNTPVFRDNNSEIYRLQ